MSKPVLAVGESPTGMQLKREDLCFPHHLPSAAICCPWLGFELVVMVWCWHTRVDTRRQPYALERQSGQPWDISGQTYKGTRAYLTLLFPVRCVGASLDFPAVKWAQPLCSTEQLNILVGDGHVGCWAVKCIKLCRSLCKDPYRLML